MARLAAAGDPPGRERPGPGPDKAGTPRVCVASNNKRSSSSSSSTTTTMFMLAYLLLGLAFLPSSSAFDEVDTTSSTTTQFRPYAPGFTGEIGEDVPRANPVVWGGQFTAESDPEKQIVSGRASEGERECVRRKQARKRLFKPEETNESIAERARPTLRSSSYKTNIPTRSPTHRPTDPQ